MLFRELTRKKQQLSNEECIELLKTEKRSVLSVMGDDGYPYGMPMNHWYDEEDGNIYFHCGRAGHRLDALKKTTELHSPARVLDEKSEKVLRLRQKLELLGVGALDRADNRFRMLCTRLEGVNPLAVLSHGYAMVEGEDGRIISSAKLS